MGFRHVRYVDDIRIFCKTRGEATKALLTLARLLRKRGLNMQSAKSEILRADTVRAQIEDVAAVVKTVRSRFIEQVARATGGDPYMSLTEADEVLEQGPDDAPIEIIRQAYQTYFIDNANKFSATLFNFLLTRLGKQGDDFAAAHCLELLEPHPYETEAILRYLAAVGWIEPAELKLIELLQPDRLAYDYQIYQIVEWLYASSTNPSEPLITCVRDIAFNIALQRYLRGMCRAFMGKFGTAADLERMADSYDETTDYSEKVEIICSRRRLERGRRNSFFARVEKDGEMNSLAVRWVKSTSGVVAASSRGGS